jgi:hypothetical protein
MLSLNTFRRGAVCLYFISYRNSDATREQPVTLLPAHASPGQSSHDPAFAPLRRKFMRPPKYLQNVLIGSTALLFAGAHFVPEQKESGPVLNAAVSLVSSPAPTSAAGVASATASVASVTKAALAAFAGAVRPLSRPQALEKAFQGYFAFKSSHPAEVKKPFLYFVDYGLPSTSPRGYLFDMDALKVVDGPFTVAHGRGSSTSQYGVPTRFSNASGSASTSLGLYVAKALYDFHGHASGQAYSSIGLRLMGVSNGFNDNALARGVVAHGAPYVTPSKAGRSEGCPAMEPSRAQRLLPKLAEGGMVFLFAPDENWLTRDPWLASNAE